MVLGIIIIIVYFEERKATKKAYVFDQKNICTFVDVRTYDSRVNDETEK